jgi:CubicO group peptidase (beta-lactamase class C family)
MADLATNIRSRAEQAIQEHVFPGCVIGTIRSNGSIVVVAVGTLDGTSPVEENTIYDVASITKSIPTTSLALMLIAEERLKLDDLVKDYLPELQNDHDATVEDLLRYRVTGPQMSKLKFETFEEIRTYIFEHGFDGQSSDNRAFTNLSAFLLGTIIERATGEILPALAHRYVFEPLKMDDTTFFPQNPYPHTLSGRTRYRDTSIAPTEIVDGQEIRGIVHDESARVFSQARRAVGHAGLFSTAPDLLNFLEAILNYGFTKPVILKAIVDGAQEGLGWEVDREWMGGKRTKKTFGKTGFTGTSVLCDTEKGIGLVILSNRTYPHRPPDNSAIMAFRKDIANIVFG